MAERRQLLIEIDRTFKLIAEGLDTFDEKLETIKSAPNKQQKEKHMAELKEDLKKLQRYRAKVMTWSTCKEVKDKRAEFEEQRLIIETRMETYREMERADKTKPFSEKALEAEPKVDPVQREHDEVFQWLRQTISTLQTQMEPWEAELERLTAEGSSGRSIMAKIDDLGLRIGQNQQHIAKLELIMRYLHNDSIDFQEVKDLRETVEAYVDSQRDSNFAVDIDYLDIYDDIIASVRENDHLLVLPVNQAQVSNTMTATASMEDIDEEPTEIVQPNRPSSTESLPAVTHSHQHHHHHKRSTIPISNYSITDDPFIIHKPTSSAVKPLHCRSVVVPAPVPPPLSVPYSQVAATGLQQPIDIDEANNDEHDAESGSAVSSASSDGKPITQCNSPDGSLSPIAVFQPERIPKQACLNLKEEKALSKDYGIDTAPKIPSAPYSRPGPLDGNESSTDDILALVCDHEKLDAVASTRIESEPADDGDQENQCTSGGPITQNEKCSIDHKYDVDRNDHNGGSDCSSPTALPSYTSSNNQTVTGTSAPLRLPKLPYAFNGAVNGFGTDSEWLASGDKADILNILDAASKRLPYTDSAMRSVYRRLWRENVPQSPFHTTYTPQYNYGNMYGVDFSSRFYYTLLTDETLIFVFYYTQGTLAQRYAIECLEERGWMWHTQRMQWFKHEKADITALRQQLDALDQKNGFVAGSFKYFDYEKWEERPATPDFVFHLKYWKSILPRGNVGYMRPPMSYSGLNSDKVIVKDGPF